MPDIELDSVYSPSEEVVARRIEGEIIIVPISAGIADDQDDLFTLNETGRAVWLRLNGKNTVRQIIDELKGKYHASPEEIQADVTGLLRELLRRRIIVKNNE